MKHYQQSSCLYPNSYFQWVPSKIQKLPLSSNSPISISNMKASMEYADRSDTASKPP